MIYSCCNENRKNAVLNNHGAIIATPTVDAAGSGYDIGDVLSIAQIGSSGTATVTVTAVNGSGGVTVISLSQDGTDYITATGVPTTGGNGSGCTLSITGTPNGIDYLEVLDHDAIPLSIPRQRTLLIHCLRPVPATVTRDNILITGGESITGITADWVAPALSTPTIPPEQTYYTSLTDAANVLVVRTSIAGDFSPYVLRLVDQAAHAEEDFFAVTDVLAGFDPQLAEVEFSFKVECPPNFDCAPQPPDCPPTLPPPPPINYLAKDYGTFRTTILDRMNQLLPGWGASSEADMGIALAELISFVGDRLSYQQDAIATEAYIETARSRISLRRHALLVDYHISDGCNARAWIQLQVAGDPGDQIFLDRTLTRFYTYAPNMPSSLAVGANNEEAALVSGVQVFEPMWDQVLYPEHNLMSFYTWGDTDCCLPKGATEATLYGRYPNLLPGDVLILQEVMGPQTGEPADADLRHRCAVRLTHVANQNSYGNPLVDPLFEDKTGLAIKSPAQSPTPVTEIQWSQDDALPFPVCISSTYLDANNDKQPLTDVSQAYGNVVLADHGLSLTGVSLGTVPSPQIYWPPNPAADRCRNLPATPLPVRFRPQVPDSPLTQAVPMTAVSVDIENPVTGNIVGLGGTGFVSLTNSDGFTCLTLQATNSKGWPQSFGVLVTANGANFDLAVVYDPPGGGSGVNKLVTVEKFTNLTVVDPSDPNYVVTQINGVSQLIQVPSKYSPPATPPSGFPATPTLLSNSGAVNLQDLGSTAEIYLTLEPTNPLGWPVLFGVSAQPNSDPAYFDLQVLYNPSSGVGVTLPIKVEAFTGLSLSTAASQINGESEFITVESYAKTADSGLSAYALMTYDPNLALPVITLSGTSDVTTETWSPQPDLLESGESDTVFVVEVESDGTATLRFGDDTNGRIPESDTQFVASYRIGNGTAGNVGADSLIFLAAHDARIQKCRNPLPATGGTDPETNDQIRRRAPQAFLTQERAITMADYAAVTEMNPQVDRAVASLRWTGSWYTVFVAVEPQGGGNLTPTLQQSLKKNVERYHLAGQDLELDSPQYVSLQIELVVCVDPNYFQSDLQQALLQVLGSGISPNGQKGFFYPDNFTFGQSVYLSPIYAAARSVEGVLAVTAKTFQPQGVNSGQYLAAGEITVGPLQVARLANDPSYPNHGQLTLDMEGGK